MLQLQAKGPLVIDRQEEAETWLVQPTPGICVKFREAKFPNLPGAESVSDKFFVNVAHCIEMPPPRPWLDEDAVVKLLEMDPNAYKIGICLGELDTVTDHNEEPVRKVDVLVNSDFFRKCISESEFFRQLTLAAICDTIKVKYHIDLNLSKQVILRNRKQMGELKAQRIRKRPLSSLADPVSTMGNPSMKEEAEQKASSTDSQGPSVDIDDIEETKERKPRNFKVQILEGKQMSIKVKVKDQQGEFVRNMGRLVVKMNDDRVVVLLDSAFTVADIHLPFQLNDKSANCLFSPDSSTVEIICPLNRDWN